MKGRTPPAAPELPREVARPRDRIEAHLALVAASLHAPPSLRDAVAYALLAGGKRIRPLLAWHAAEACSSPGDAALPACAAVELVHAFSLVHDDLPALDNDDLRRGKPTLHLHAGEAMAILAGDAMLAHAFALLAESYPGPLAASLASELSRACSRMIAGQVLDTLGWQGRAPESSPREHLEEIHRGKTGAMIEASARMGALVADADRESLARITEYARAIGLMFQVVDDLVDVEQTSEHAGKRTGKDAGKLTYPGVLGVEGSRALVASLREQALSAIRPLAEPAAPLAALCEHLAVRTR